jgi:hypothetical protein
VRYIKKFESIHDRWEQQAIEKEDIKEFAETLFVNLLDDGFTVETNIIYSESSQDPNKYVEVYVRVPNENKYRSGYYPREAVRYSNISNEIQTFVDYMKRKWRIIDVTYEYEELIPDKNIPLDWRGAHTKVRTESKEPSQDTKIYDGKFNLTIKQLDKEPNMFQKFIKRF